MRDKIQSLLGFAVKARKVVLGTDNIEKSGRARLIVVCSALSQNSLDRLLRQSNLPVIQSLVPLEDIIYISGVKALAVTDKQMAQAIISNISPNYRLVREEKPVE